MSTTSRLLSAIAAFFRPASRAPVRRVPRAPAKRFVSDDSPGQWGVWATIEVDPSRIGAVTMTYVPRTDGTPDPGEVVWTWVPYQERDGRGKDRPVLVVAAEPSGTVLAVQLTSQEHPGRRDFIPIGTGGWDGQQRASWVNIGRVFRLHQGGMRRETTALDGRHYETVRAALVARYGWRSV